MNSRNDDLTNPGNRADRFEAEKNASCVRWTEPILRLAAAAIAVVVVVVVVVVVGVVVVVVIFIVDKS